MLLGAKGTRTLYLLIANQSLYQMSYGPWICIHKPTAERQNCQLVRPSEEAMKRLKSGCGLFGRLLNSG